MSSAEPSSKKNWSCGGCFVIGFFGFIAIVLIGAVAYGVSQALRNDSRFSAQAEVQVVKKKPGVQYRKTDTLMTYRYRFAGHEYQNHAVVYWKYGVPLFACVDPKKPAEHYLLDNMDRETQCGDKKLDGVRHTAHLVSTTTSH